MPYTVQHVGYPVAGRPIRPDEWATLSTHKTESAAWKRVTRETSHLQSGQWDDHYRVFDPDGHRCYWDDYYESDTATDNARRVRRGKTT
jgi:hypothetical protein